jgi:hypothetical protein
VAPGSDLHVSLGTQHLLAAERVLGAALAGWEGSDEGEDEEEEGSGWARRQLQEADRRAYTAYAARYVLKQCSTYGGAAALCFRTGCPKCMVQADA